MSSAIRLNLGSGKQKIDGYLTVDVDPARKPDIVSDVTKLPLPDNYADEIMAIHLFEHLWRWETMDVLTEWRRVLKPGGKLVLEMPDLIKCCRAILANETPQNGMWGVYGDPGHRNPLMCHRWGWTEETLRAELLTAGFRNVRSMVAVFHRPSRDMRMEANKP